MDFLRFFIVVIFGMMCFLGDAVGKNNMENTQRSWPSREHCVEIVIKKYARAGDRSHSKADKDKPAKIKKVTDKVAIDKVFALLQKLPVDGEMMKSFTADISLTTLDFNYGESSAVVLIYDNHVKTPSTGFLTDPDELVIEKSFVDFVKSLLK